MLHLQIVSLAKLSTQLHDLAELLKIEQRKFEELASPNKKIAFFFFLIG